LQPQCQATYYTDLYIGAYSSDQIFLERPLLSIQEEDKKD